MEGRLKKYFGFFSGWKEYKYILHEGILHEYDIETNIEVGTVHMLISSITVNAEKPLEITTIIRIKVETNYFVNFFNIKNILYRVL